MAFQPNTIILKVFKKSLIAGIYGPLLNQDCMHIWSSTKLLLQAYLIPTLTDIAGMIAPYNKVGRAFPMVISSDCRM